MSESIRLNFVSLKDQNVEISIYRKLVEGNEPRDNLDLYRTRLPSDPEAEEWRTYDVSFERREGFEVYSCALNLNASLAEYYLYRELIWVLQNSTYKNFELPKNSKYKEVVFPVEIKTKGRMEVIVHPYYLRTRKVVGFLFQCRFSLNNPKEFDRQAQIESLSLDKSGRPNFFMCRDKEVLISNFLDGTFRSLVGGSGLDVQSGFEKVHSSSLDKKQYLVGGNFSAPSQFMGIKNRGPYRAIDKNVRYLFLFTERMRSLGRDLYLGLTGKLFPSQFPGLNMFNMEIGKNVVDHYLIDDFNSTSLEDFSSYLSEYKERFSKDKLILVVILPKGFKGVEGAFDAYGHLKLLSLKKQLPCQFITEDTFFRKDQLKWSISNIGLQIFSKLGGAPWLVKPAKKNCLILGLGSSHERQDGVIKKWFAYTVCLDSSGDFKYVRPLSKSNNEISYLDGLKASLKEIMTTESESRYSSFVLHVPFKIKRSEIEAIKEVVKSVKEGQCEVVVIRINTEHKYIGFSEHNTRIPYESSLVQLSGREFLLWAEGLQYGKEVLHKRVSDPLLVDFIEPPESWESKKDYLQDILNLTGANWRGFNSKAQPISIRYSKFISDFMKEFSHLEDVDHFDFVETESVSPWFL